MTSHPPSPARVQSTVQDARDAGGDQGGGKSNGGLRWLVVLSFARTRTVVPRRAGRTLPPMAGAQAVQLYGKNRPRAGSGLAAKHIRRLAPCTDATPRPDRRVGPLDRVAAAQRVTSFRAWTLWLAPRPSW